MKLLITLLASTLSLAACSSNPDFKPIEKAPIGDTFSKSGQYRLGVNDVVEIRVVGQPDFNGTYIISQSGTLNLPLIGMVTAKGQTERQLFLDIEMRLKPYIKNPVVSLSIVNYESYKVYISGTVRSPGVFIFKEPTTLIQAIASAGGLTNLSNGEIILHRKGAKGKVEKFRAAYDEIVKGNRDLNGFVLERGDVLYVQ